MVLWPCSQQTIIFWKIWIWLKITSGFSKYLRTASASSAGASL